MILRICMLCFFMYSIAHANQTIKVAVSIPPLHFFVESIAQTRANITIIVPHNKNPETYEPTFKDMQALQESDMFIGIGMPFETIWLPKLLKANNQEKSLTTILLHKELQKENDMHLWLSIQNARHITQSITNALIAKDSKNANFYRQNATKLLQSLERLDQTIKQHIATMPRKDFITYHPLLDSASMEYGLQEHALEQHGKKYGMQEILSLSDFGKKAGIKRIFAEHINKDITALAKAMQAEVVLLNPMATNYIENLESIFTEIAKSYQ